MKFSVCIPNYNYETYIAETIKSVLSQSADLEILVNDNNSTDGSVIAVQTIEDNRIRIGRNTWNVGFSANLDKACQPATGDRMILLSSDDLAGTEALSTYKKMAEHLGEKADRAVFASEHNVIDENGVITGKISRDLHLWQDAILDISLSAILGAQVYRVSALKLLARSLAKLRTPISFATTCYPRSLYSMVEGYGGGYLYNPDKAFSWKLLTVADEVFYVEKPLFSYRIHDANQASQQQQTGALKHLMDQYRSTFDLAPETMEAAGVTRQNLAKAFIEQDIVRRGLKYVTQGNRVLARRGLDFGRATYPDLVAGSSGILALRAALCLGPLGTMIAKVVQRFVTTRCLAKLIDQGI